MTLDNLLDDWQDSPSALEVVESLNGSTLYVASRMVLMDRTISALYQASFRAADLRRERTGVHAKVEILINGTPLRWSNFNVERDEDRGRLANAAHGMLSPILKEQYPKAAIKADLDNFCWKMWDAHLQAQDAELVAGDPDEQLSFLLRPYVIEGGGTILFAPPSRGKSFTLLAMAVSIDAGVNTLWQSVRQSKTLIINLERSASSIRRRLGMINFSLGLESNRPMYVMNARGRSLLDIKDAVRRSVDQHGIECIALDSISRAGMGSLVKDDTATSTMDLLNALGPTWLAIGHTPRKDESHVFGSQQYDAAADVAVKIISQRRGPVLGVGLQIVKENDIGPTDIGKLAFQFDGHGLHEVRKANHDEFAVLDTITEMSIPDQMEDYILEQPSAKATATEIGEALSIHRTLASRILNQEDRFIKLPKDGKTQSFGVKSFDV
jgi:hypothetical protein